MRVLQVQNFSLASSYGKLFAVWVFVCVSGVADGETLYSAQYQYDLRGMVTNLLETYSGETTEMRSLDYDSLGRISHEKLGAHEVGFQYDRLGNRLQKFYPSDPSKQSVLQYNTRNEMCGQDFPNLGVHNEFFYDLNGSLTQKVFGANTVQYEWDVRGRLSRVLTNGVEVFHADYAGSMKRLRKTEAGQSRVYRHDGLTAIQELDEAGKVKELVRSDRGAATVGGVLYSADEEGTNSYTYNGVGSTVVLSRDDGVAQTVRYDAFGNILENSEGIKTDRLANTKELDKSTGLYFHGARYYDAELGRYISVDPARDGLNHYVYANNAPLSYVDPTGLFFVPFAIGIGIGLTVAAGSTMWDNASAPMQSSPGITEGGSMVDSYRDTRPGMQLHLDLIASTASSTTFVDSGVNLSIKTPAMFAGLATKAQKFVPSAAYLKYKLGLHAFTRAEYSFPLTGMDLSPLTRDNDRLLGIGSFGRAAAFKNPLVTQADTPFAKTYEELVVKWFNRPQSVADAIARARTYIPPEIILERSQRLVNEQFTKGAYMHALVRDGLMNHRDPTLPRVAFAPVIAADSENYTLVSTLVNGLAYRDTLVGTRAHSAFQELWSRMPELRDLVTDYIRYARDVEGLPWGGAYWKPLDGNLDNFHLRFVCNSPVFKCFDP